jgi:hypothetical protein
MPLKIFTSSSLTFIEEMYAEWEKEAAAEKEAAWKSAYIMNPNAQPIGLAVMQMQLTVERTTVSGQFNGDRRFYILSFLHN